MKIRPVGAELFRATRTTEGRTERHDEGNSLCQHAKKSVTVYYMVRPLPKSPGSKDSNAPKRYVTHTHTHTHISSLVDLAKPVPELRS